MVPPFSPLQHRKVRFVMAATASQVIQQLHAIEEHDTDTHASEYFHAQPDDPWDA